MAWRPSRKDGRNQALQQVDALANLVQVGGELVIRDNPALRTVDGLLNLAQVGALTVLDNRALLDLAGLRSLEALAGGLSLTGLSSLQVVETNLIIQGNEVLTELGMEALEEVGDLVSIRDNPRLSTQAAEEFAARVGATADIRNNGAP
ncbi:MAG: hypothetical protein AB2A00_43610 [Myxococcota bacterium]